MQRTVSYLTRIYANNTLFLKRKAEYSSVFMGLILCMMVLIQVIELIFIGFKREEIISTLVFISAFLILFLLLYKGLLELCLNLLIVSGFLRCLMMMSGDHVIQFYSMLFLILLAIGVVHIKQYQLYISYAVSIIISLIRILIFRQQDIMGDMQSYQAVYSLFIMTVYIVMVQFIVHLIEKEIQESAKLILLAETDSLTGVGNRRRLQSALLALDKNRIGYSLLLIDLDFFKRINDEFGHDQGDLVLIEFAELINTTIRNEDSLYRWGGEEFLILMPALPPADLITAAERIRASVENFLFLGHLNVTISIGAAFGDDSSDLATLIKKADKELYRAKKSGRNRVCHEFLFEYEI